MISSTETKAKILNISSKPCLTAKQKL